MIRSGFEPSVVKFRSGMHSVRIMFKAVINDSENILNLIYFFSSFVTYFFLCSLFLNPLLCVILFLPLYSVHSCYVHSPFLSVSYFHCPILSFPSVTTATQIMKEHIGQAGKHRMTRLGLCDISCFTDDRVGTVVHINFCATQES